MNAFSFKCVQRSWATSANVSQTCLAKTFSRRTPAGGDQTSSDCAVIMGCEQRLQPPLPNTSARIRTFFFSSPAPSSSVPHLVREPFLPPLNAPPCSVPPACGLLQLLIQFHPPSTALRAASRSFFFTVRWIMLQGGLTYNFFILFSSCCFSPLRWPWPSNLLLDLFIYFLICCLNLQPGVFQVIAPLQK